MADPVPSSGTLSLNLGGVNLNYDLGPNTSAVVDQSLAFLNNTFDVNRNFVGGAIVGGQNFLNGIISPVLKMAADQQTFNTSQLPQMFNTLTNQNFVLGSEAISTEGTVAASQIAQANATANMGGGGGFCYITTAVCETMRLPDDCYALETLRAFRDGYMQETAERRALVQEYYDTAPGLLSAIRAHSGHKEFLGDLFGRFIVPAILAIEQGDEDRAFAIYRHMVHHVIAAVNAHMIAKVA